MRAEALGPLLPGRLITIGGHPDGVARRARPDVHAVAVTAAGRAQASLRRQQAALRTAAAGQDGPTRRRLALQAATVAVLRDRWSVPAVEAGLRDALAAFGPERALALDAQPNLQTTAGRGYVVDAWQASVTLANLKYQGYGTSATAATLGDTALGAECTTVINPDSTRATSTVGDGASATILRFDATMTFDGVAVLREWGLFSQAATGGGVLYTRIVLASPPTTFAGYPQFARYELDLTPS